MDKGLELPHYQADLRAMTGDATAWSLMVGIGETYLPAFVLAVSTDQLAAGIVATVPMAIGAVLQAISPRAVRWVGSYRRWVVLCALIQAVAFLPLTVGALLGVIPMWTIFLIASVYWGASMAAGPAWNNWIESLLPREVRASHFTRRTRASHIGLLVGFLLGGLLLEVLPFESPVTAFGVLFLLAAAARVVSAYFLRCHRETMRPNEECELPRLPELIAVFRKEVDLRVLTFLVTMQMAVWIAGPYFTPFMFAQLELSYSAFIVLTATAFVARIVSLPMHGRAIERWGVKRVLWINGLAMAPVPALWLLDSSYVYLLGLQLLAGVAWGGYELAMLLSFFDSVDRRRRMSVLVLYNIISSAAVIAGSLVGASIIGMLGANGLAYGVLFALSSAVRGATLLLLVRLPALRLDSLFFIVTRPIALRPTTGSIDRPILASLEATPASPLDEVPAVAMALAVDEIGDAPADEAVPAAATWQPARYEELADTIESGPSCQIAS